MNLTEFIRLSLQEDVGEGDHTSLSTVPENSTGKAKLLVKESGIIAGVEIALEIFKEVDPNLSVEVLIIDGTQVKPGDIVLTVSGSDRSILKAERLVLNCMQRMSGIATTTHKFNIKLEGLATKVLDTRKTTPLMRALEKMAVRIGGGHNHRMGLYDMILIKDNHVDYAGGIKQAIRNAKAYLHEKKLTIPVEIETRNLGEVEEVLAEGGVDRIMLDNFNTTDLRRAVTLINKQYITEASGGITLDTIRSYAETGVDFISVGALTHSVKSLDLSLKAYK
ncbi:MAG: carboxylating nicotinate-nucleotide diphosphorylase [Bacteroidetes bacterium]|nr:carboxylating nicotinate-nucleotide diphosphorylase [Bacteroidota bacterium]